jgi:hypothetical protein
VPGVSSSGSGGGSGSSSGSTSSGCQNDASQCPAFECDCVDGTIFPGLHVCSNGVCEGASDNCPSLCSSDGGWTG